MSILCRLRLHRWRVVQWMQTYRRHVLECERCGVRMSRLFERRRNPGAR